MAKWSTVVLLGMLACKSGEVRPKLATPPPPTPGLARVPKVSVASVVVATPEDPPSVVLVLDVNSDLHAATVATWDKLAIIDPVVGSHFTTPYGAELRLREGEGKGTAAIYASFARSDASIERQVAKRLATEPPPEEEEDDDSDDESTGGMELDEGRMGKKDSGAEPRAKKPWSSGNRDAVLARVIELSHLQDHRRLTQVAGARTVDTEPYFGFGYPSPPPRTGGPDPLATTVTEWMDETTLEKSSSVLLAAPSLPATELISLVARLHPRIAVAEGTRVRPLRLETSEESDWDRADRWLELRLGAFDLTLEAVPENPLPVRGPLDLATLAAALDEARGRRDLDPLARVDVLVDPSVDVQRLIDLLVALEQVGVKMVGLGEIPTTDSVAARQRGHRSAEVSFGQPNAQGDLDKAIIRRHVKHMRPQILACYASSSVYLAGTTGTVHTQFFITPDGNVASSAASGVDPKVSTCVADVIKAIEFPKPKGGGGVQVNYPFTFRR